MSLVDDVFTAVTAGLDYRRDAHRFQGVYARRRAVALVASDPSATAPALIAAIARECGLIATHIAVRIAQLVDGTVADPQSPPHLDLDDCAQLVEAPPFAATLTNAIRSQRRGDFQRNRARWIPEIVWGAVGLHPTALWSDATPARTLMADALDELLDRRLRAVERMTCNVNGASDVTPSWTIAGATGPWLDGRRPRLFEYASVPAAPFAAILAGDPDWSAGGGGFNYAPLPAKIPVRMPDAISADCDVGVTAGGTIWVELEPSTMTGSTLIQRMFETPRTDFRQRSWLLCDHVCSALALEALWFANHRRRGTDVAFDALFQPGHSSHPYVSLGPVVTFEPQDLGTLMADGAADPAFENLEVPVDELQVGDFVAFWNSRMYTLLEGGVWGSEFSYVMGIDHDPATAKVRVTADGLQIRLAGHGVPTESYSAMASDLVDHLKITLMALRYRVIQAYVADPTITEIQHAPFALVRWDPYEPFEQHGAWWIRIRSAFWRDEWKYPTLEAAHDAVAGTVIHDSAPGVGYQPPPTLDALYFPLFEPAIYASASADSWHQYLARRRADPAYRPHPTLGYAAVDTRLAQGLFYRGKRARVPIVRPRIARL